MHHYRLLAGAIFGNVLQPEASREVEVELHGRELPETADCVHQLDVDLRTVERRFAGNRLVLDSKSLQNFFQRSRRHIPLIFAAHKVRAVRRVPRRKLSNELIEAKIFENVARELNAVSD